MKTLTWKKVILTHHLIEKGCRESRRIRERPEAANT